jgi:hypothetical protein
MEGQEVDILSCILMLSLVHRGLQARRPVLSIDGTFLLGKYMGTLLVAISCDADNALVPLAFALVEREKKDN